MVVVVHWGMVVGIGNTFVVLVVVVGFQGV
jgi:hypothetical protein